MFKIANILLRSSFLILIPEYGVSKGQAALEKTSICLLNQELNDAVKAKFIEEYPETLIETNPSFFSQFTLVIATQVWIDGAHV